MPYGSSSAAAVTGPGPRIPSRYRNRWRPTPTAGGGLADGVVSLTILGGHDAYLPVA
jgi:hypothetical protein